MKIANYSVTENHWTTYVKSSRTMDLYDKMDVVSVP